MGQQSAHNVDAAVPLAFARALLVQARAHGCDIDGLLETARFPFNPLHPPPLPATVSIEHYSRLCMALFRDIGDESGGVMAGTHTPFGTTRLLLYCVLRCDNLRAAMERAIEFNACCREPRGVVRLHDLVTHESSKLATLRYVSMPDPDQLLPQEGMLCGLAMWIRLCGWLTGQCIDIVSASCAGPAPRSTLAIRHFFHCPVRFGATCNSVTFSARHLEAELVRSPSDLELFMRVAPYHLVIKPIHSAASITTRISAILGGDLRGELPSFDELTGLLNMSARTLRRRLESEGTCYQRIKDNARRDVAISLLTRERMTVSDVAERVGFSDPSAFHRSFKKWTGQSPGAYGERIRC